MFHIEHTPRSLDEIAHHKDLNQRLKRLATFWEETPHIIFSGPNGSGKKTIVNGLLRQLYGNIIDNFEVKQDGYFTVLVSPVHIEYFLTEKTSRNFIDDLISRIKAINVRNATFHTIVLHNLSEVAVTHQISLRKLYEKYTETARFITITSSLGRIKSVKNRSLCIRVQHVTKDECVSIFEDISKKTNTPIESSFVLEKFEENNYNLLDTFIEVDRYIQLQSPLKKPVTFGTVEDIFDRLMSSIKQHQPKLIQSCIHELIVVPLKTSEICRGIFERCVEEIDDSESLSEVARLSAFYDWKCRKTSNIVYVVVILCYHLSSLFNKSIRIST